MIATVFCQVSWSDDAPVGRLPVEVHQVVYDRPRSVEQRLAQGRTDLDGSLSLVFPAVFQGLVRVRVLGIDGNPIGGEVLVAPLTGVHRVAVVLARPGSRYSEVERLFRAIRPWTDGQLRRLLTWEPSRLEHIAAQTGRPLAHLVLLQQAAVLSEQVGVPVELLYGLGRADLPLTIRDLARHRRTTRRRALARAISMRWIPTLPETHRKRYLDHLTAMLGPGARLRAFAHGQWSQWRRQELMTAVDWTTATVMTLL
ncbi:MAG: hypothetical protein ACI8RZ_006209 [Myxococcota bacterium]|jgi:hypothetical protein